MYLLKLLESIITLTWMALALVITIFGLAFYNSNSTKGNLEPEAFCVVVTERDRMPKAEHPKFDEGKALFKNNCATCHNRNMTDDLTGPALGGVTGRWAEYPKTDLYKWIRNSRKLVDANHPRAKKLYKDWNNSTMNAFPNLTDENIEAILVYIER